MFIQINYHHVIGEAPPHDRMLIALRYFLNMRGYIVKQLTRRYFVVAIAIGFTPKGLEQEMVEERFFHHVGFPGILIRLAAQEQQYV